MAQIIRMRKILMLITSDHKKRLFSKNRRRDKHTSLLSKLFIQFQDARNKGRRCSHTWIYTRAKQIHKRDFPNARPLPKSIVVKFNVGSKKTIQTTPQV